MKLIDIEKAVKRLNEAAVKVLGESRDDRVIDRGDGIVLSLETGEWRLDYYNPESHETMIEIEEASGLVGHFETETAGSAIFYFD